MIGWGARVFNETGPEVSVDCLWCSRQAVRAETRRETGFVTLFYIVPVFPVRNVFVRCTACRKEMIARCSWADIARSSPVTLQHHLIKSQSFVGLVCILLGLLLCWAPMIGLIPAVIGFVYRSQFGSGMKRLSKIGLICSLLTTVIGVAAMLLSRAASQH